MPQTSQQHRDVALDIADDIVVEADYDQLLRVFGNLMRNAFEAGASKITITARTCDTPRTGNSNDLAGPLELWAPGVTTDDPDDVPVIANKKAIQILIADDGPGLPEKTIINDRPWRQFAPAGFGATRHNLLRHPADPCRASPASLIGIQTCQAANYGFKAAVR
jgi:hypothetical protein